MVWLDPPLALVMAQVIGRKLARRVDGRELWNGNVEPPLSTFFTDRDHIVRWACRTRRLAGDRVRQLADQRPELGMVRLASHREADGWLAGPLAASTLLA